MVEWLFKNRADPNWISATRDTVWTRLITYLRYDPLLDKAYMEPGLDTRRLLKILLVFLGNGASPTEDLSFLKESGMSHMKEVKEIMEMTRVSRRQRLVKAMLRRPPSRRSW